MRERRVTVRAEEPLGRRARLVASPQAAEHEHHLDVALLSQDPVRKPVAVRPEQRERVRRVAAVHRAMGRAEQLALCRERVDATRSV